MQAFARVVETGSFTKAAETLHMSKTSVTQLVQQLEARLRVKLLNRTTRKVNVTADGAVFYERVVRLLADMDDAETSLSGASVQPRGRLRVDVPSPLARLILMPALPGFHARYPDIQIDMGVSDRIVDIIGENVDCVVRGGELTDQSLMARRVGELQLGVFAAPSYLERLGTPAHPLELEDSEHRIVGFLWARTGKALPYAMRNGNERVHIKGRYVLAVDDGNAYLRRGWREWAFSGCPTTCPKPTKRGVNWCGCSRIGASNRCHSTWRFRRTGISAQRCGCLSIGWRS